MRGHGLLLGRLLAVCVTLAAQAAGMPRPVEAQTVNEIGALKAQLERRFEVLPLQDGVLLRPRAATAGVRSIEVHQGAIAIDGQVVTGAELRSRLGGEADLVGSHLTKHAKGKVAILPSEQPRQRSARSLDDRTRQRDAA